MLCVEMPNAGMCFYTGVHQRLRVTRLVAFVVSTATEPDKLGKHVVAVAKVVLTPASHSLDNRINEFQMAGIARKPYRELTPRFRFPDAYRALMVFHVAFVGREIRMGRSLEHGEDTFGHIAFFRV